MSFENPAHQIPRQSVVGMEGLWAKMFDPPTYSPSTPELMAPTNPVPEVMALAGFQDTPSIPHTVQRDLLHGEKIPTWDGAVEMDFMLIRDADNPLAAGTFPGPIVRVPRGVIYHAETQGHGPPPHTIHWHGIEPTPMNDGVGHCSMEIGEYIYQWQPNFIGFYFYHCHRNTVQHFEFGLYSALFVETPDAYFASLNADGTLNTAIPIGAGRDGLRRIATNLSLLRGPTDPGDPSSYTAGSGHGFEGPLVFATQEDVLVEFPGFNSNPITAPDPEADNPEMPAHLKFLVDPHAMTVPFDVEVFWNPDDRDSVWSEEAPNARATYPRHGDIPGVNDNFAGNAGGGVGPDDFFAFNDFRPDYFYITGVPVPAHIGETGTLAPGSTIPGFLNGGIVGTQIAVQAQVGQTILLRALNAAYVCVTYTLPVDAIIIAWDGRSLGVPPYGECNHPYLVPAGTPIHASVARRFDALIKSDVEFHGFATIDFVDTRAQVPGDPPSVLVTAQIPFDIGPVPPVGETYSVTGTIEDDMGAPMEGIQVTVSPHSLGGSGMQIVVTDAAGVFTASGLNNGMYQILPHAEGLAFTPMQIDVSINGADITDLNFVAGMAALGYRIRGTITDDQGVEMEGVQVVVVPRSVGASPRQAVLTDNNGRYEFINLMMGDYRITPVLAGYAFTPERLEVTVMDMDLDFQDFAAAVDVNATFAVSGTIADGSFHPVAGVAVTLASGGTAVETVTTLANGVYTANVGNGVYTITPVKAGYTFVPASIDVTVNSATIGLQNFAATAVVVPPEEPGVYGAENAALSGGCLVSTAVAGYTGAGFVDFVGPSGESITWTVTVPTAGSRRLDFRYALSSGNRPLRISVNGAVVNASMAFPATGSFANWQTAGLFATLNAGVNTVTATSIGSSGANVDSLTVGPAAPVVGGVYGAETAVLGGGCVLSTAIGGYTGAGFVDYVAPGGEFAEWTVNATSAGPHRLRFRYSLAAGNRPLRITVNGTVVNASMAFPGAGGWTNWQTADITAALNAGANTVRATSIGSSGPNVNSLTVSPAPVGVTYGAENAALSGAVVSTAVAGYTGTGFADYVNASNDFVEWTVNAAAAGSYELEFRYAYSSGNRRLRLSVNGAVVNDSMAFPATGSFTNWQTVTTIVTLNAGANTVRATAIGSSGPNVDYLKVTAQ